MRPLDRVQVSQGPRRPTVDHAGIERLLASPGQGDCGQSNRSFGACRWGLATWTNTTRGCGLARQFLNAAGPERFWHLCPGPLVSPPGTPRPAGIGSSLAASR